MLRRNKFTRLLPYLTILGFSVLVIACPREAQVPQEKVLRKYVSTPDSLPFSFLIPEQSTVVRSHAPDQGSYYIDLLFPDQKARLYGTFHASSAALFPRQSEESRKIVYFHSVKADAIREEWYENPTAGVYGILYTLEGKVATPLQLSLTDSLNYLFHGSLYFDEGESHEGKGDTLRVLTGDLRKLMETFKYHPGD